MFRVDDSKAWARKIAMRKGYGEIIQTAVQQSIVKYEYRDGLMLGTTKSTENNRSDF